MDGETRYAAAAAGDTEAIVDWEKEADLEFNYEAISHSVTKYIQEHRDFILEKLANKKFLFKRNGDEETALHLAAKKGDYRVVDVLIDAASLLDSPSHPPTLLDDFVWHPNCHKDTPLHLALSNGYKQIAEMLVCYSHLHDGRDIQNHLGETPVYLAVKLGYHDIVRKMCRYWKGFIPFDGPYAYYRYCTTALHTAIINFPRERGNSDVITDMIKSRKKKLETPMSYSGYEPIFDKADKNYDTVLSLSVRELQMSVVETILAEDPAYRNGRVRKSIDLKSLISVAAKKPENWYMDMVSLLNKSYEAGKDILHKAIRNRDRGRVYDCLREDEDLVSKVDSEGRTPLHYAAYYDFYTILDATHVGYNAEEYESANQTRWVPTPLHVAAKGHTSTLMKLMELLPHSLYIATDLLTRQNILHLAVLASKKEMIRHIIKKYCPDKYIGEILNQQDVNDDTLLHLLIRDGCFVPELIKHKKIRRSLINYRGWTSFDMLYFKDQIIADQVKIKKALDDFQADQHRKFWRRSIKRESQMPKSLVPPSKLTAKDNEFMEAKKLLMKENLIQMKDELDRYRQGPTLKL